MNESSLVLAFEREADPDLRLIPLVVRMKLDLCGKRMGLKTWQALRDADRQQLVSCPVGTREELAGYGDLLQRLCGEDALAQMSQGSLDGRDAWRADMAPTAEVMAMLARLDSDLDWSALDMFGRYVLTHLASRDAFEKFSAAAAELVRT